MSMTTVKPQAWSYSALEAFENCPYRYKLTKLTKQVADPPSAAGEWGNRVHKALENYIKTRTPLGPELEQYQKLVDSVVQRAGSRVLHAEQRLCLNRNFEAVPWFAKDAWVRGITDFTIEDSYKLFIGDWKTGKPIPNSAQLRLTAVMSFAHKSWIDEITTAFVWIKSGKVQKETVHREQIPEVWDEFLPRVKRLQDAVNDDKFPKRPSGLCGWCPVKTCEHWKPPR